MAQISSEIGRNISLLINRKGHIEHIFIGTPEEINFDSMLGRSREARYRLRGYRVIYASPKRHELTQSDLSVLLNERLDLIGYLATGEDGTPGKFSIALVMPPSANGNMWEIKHYNDLGRIDIELDSYLTDLENQLEKKYMEIGGDDGHRGALLIGFSTVSRAEAEISLEELVSLTESANRNVLDKRIQVSRKSDPRFLIGKGKLEEIYLAARHIGADTLIFNQELNPAQVRAIYDETNLEIVDRTQLIMEIFAMRAKTSEGKLQVQLAQARYALPRLSGKGRQFSQLGGGIGTRGPGETKLEEQKRSLRKQIEILEKKIEGLSRRRSHTRKYRMSQGILTVTLIGYTNAGKSTLFNSLTGSDVLIQNRMFSTLNPTTRKLYLPGDKQILLTDTVGFISQLPKELVNAFRATLEELGESSLLVHVADISDPFLDEKIESVNKILMDCVYDSIPIMMVLNKSDKISVEIAKNISARYNSHCISAKDSKSLADFLKILDEKLTDISHLQQAGSDKKIAL